MQIRPRLILQNLLEYYLVRDNLSPTIFDISLFNWRFVRASNGATTRPAAILMRTSEPKASTFKLIRVAQIGGLSLKILFTNSSNWTKSMFFTK